MNCCRTRQRLPSATTSTPDVGWHRHFNKLTKKYGEKRQLKNDNGEFGMGSCHNETSGLQRFTTYTVCRVSLL